MTNQEAIQELQRKMRFYREPYLCVAVELAIEALKKQIPKKPIIETISASTDEIPLIVGFCPNCINNRPMVTNRYDLYCRSCGQVLDWGSEVEDNG
jgi:hypothetical protein